MTGPKIDVSAFRRPVIYLVRHCSTPLNSEDMYRGWADPELSPNGHAEAEKIQGYFSYEPLGPIVAADFRRCVQTAEYILPFSRYTHFVDVNANLRTLNIGEFSGKPVTPENEKKLDYFVRHPDEPIPGGESLHGFEARWEETLNSYLAGAREELPTVLVVEGCNIGASAWAAMDENERPEVFDPYENTIVEPGGIIGVFLDERGDIAIKPLFGYPEKSEIMAQ